MISKYARMPSGKDSLQYFSTDSTKLRIQPKTVLIASLIFIGLVVLLHVYSKMSGTASKTTNDGEEVKSNDMSDSNNQTQQQQKQQPQQEQHKKYQQQQQNAQQQQQQRQQQKASSEDL